MSPEGRLTLQLVTMAATVVLDIAVGKFSDQPKLVMAGWVILALVVAGSFEFYKELVHDRLRRKDDYRRPGTSANRLAVVEGFFRPIKEYGFWTFVRAVLAAIFATCP